MSSGTGEARCGRMTGRDWRHRAACRAEDPELFFGAGTPAQARRVCAGCPVRAECLAFALADVPAAGVWAGKTAQQIQRLAGPQPDPEPPSLAKALDEHAGLPRGLTAVQEAWRLGVSVRTVQRYRQRRRAA